MGRQRSTLTLWTQYGLFFLPFSKAKLLRKKAAALLTIPEYLCDDIVSLYIRQWINIHERYRIPIIFSTEDDLAMLRDMLVTPEVRGEVLLLAPNQKGLGSLLKFLQSWSSNPHPKK